MGGIVGIHQATIAFSLLLGTLFRNGEVVVVLSNFFVVKGPLFSSEGKGEFRGSCSIGCLLDGDFCWLLFLAAKTNFVRTVC